MQPSSPPPPAEIEQALERVLASRALRASRNLTAFLRFVVTRTLAGESAALKEYTVGVEVFGRGESFDPKADGVVRVHAGMLRKKLAAYYEDEGRDDPLVIEIPKGGYVPVFRRAAGADSDPATAGEATAPAPTVAARPRTRARWPWTVAALTGALAIVLFWSTRERDIVEPPGPPWQGFFGNAAPTLLAVGTPQFFSGGDGVYVRDIRVNTPDAGADPRLAAIQDAVGGALRPAEVYTGIGEAHGAAALGQFFARHGRELRVLRSRHVGWDDLKETHVIFLSSMRFRTLAQLLDRPSDFVFGDGEVSVHDRKPAPGEPIVYPAGTGVDHAIITLWPGQIPGRQVLHLSGRTTWATQAAAEYVTRPEYLAELARHLEACRQRRGAREHAPSWQALLRVEVRDEQPLGITYVTHHDL